ncbi:MAG: DUF1508 domain-containing protein [Clostridia bacterium]|nr:DUF1508 domain-containing protein [Clostridia bacterium]
MAGKFVIIKTKNDGYKFNLKAANGEIVATGEVYSSLESCENGIGSVRRNASAAIEDTTVPGHEVLQHPKYEVYKDRAEEFRFRLKSSNGRIIATGESYVSKAGCLNGIKSIAKNAPDASVIIE